MTTVRMAALMLVLIGSSTTVMAQSGISDLTSELTSPPPPTAPGSSMLPNILSVMLGLLGGAVVFIILQRRNRPVAPNPEQPFPFRPTPATDTTSARPITVEEMFLEVEPPVPASKAMPTPTERSPSDRIVIRLVMEVMRRYVGIIPGVERLDTLFEAPTRSELFAVWQSSIQHRLQPIVDVLRAQSVEGAIRDMSDDELFQQLLAHPLTAERFTHIQPELASDTLDLPEVEAWIDQHFHGKVGLSLDLRSIKEVLLDAPTWREWQDQRNAFPDTIHKADGAQLLIAAGQVEHGLQSFRSLLTKPRIGPTILERQYALLRFATGDLDSALAHLAGRPGPVLAILSRCPPPNGAQPLSLSRGTIIDQRYRIVEEIDRDELRMLYRVVSIDLITDAGAEYVLEVSTNAHDIARSVERVRLALRLAQQPHPHVLRYHQYVYIVDPRTLERSIGLITAYTEMQSLAKVLAERRMMAKPFTLTEVRHIIMGVCEALAHAHSFEPPIIHRDVRPANIVLTSDGQVLLRNFGSHAGSSHSVSSSRSSAEFSLTSYQPPESIKASHRPDPRYDIFLVGNLLIELLTLDPNGVPDLREDCPTEWLDLIGDALSRVVNKRPATIRIFAERFAAVPMSSTRETESIDEEFVESVPPDAVEPTIDANPIANEEPTASLESDESLTPPPVETITDEPVVESAPTPSIVALPDPAEPIHDSPVSEPTPEPESVVEAPIEAQLEAQPEAQVAPVAIVESGPPPIELPPLRECIVDLHGAGDCRTISEALARCETGGTIRVRPGIYHEMLTLEREVKLFGDGAAGTIVVDSPSGCALRVRAQRTHVRGLHFRTHAEATEFPYLVDIDQGEGLLEQCELSHGSAGCLAVHQPQAAPRIRSCRIHSSSAGSGVFWFDGASGTMEACEIFGNRLAGIEIRAASPLIRKCRIRDGHGGGLLIGEGARGRIEECDIFHNQLSGIQVKLGADPLVSECLVHDSQEGNGVYVFSGGKGTFEACEIFGNKLSGVAVSSDGAPVIRNCRIRDGQSSGVYVCDAGLGMVEDCEISGNAYAGVRIKNQGNPIIRRCRILRNAYEAARIDTGGRGTFVGCELADNRLGDWSIEAGCDVERRDNRESTPHPV